MALDESERLDSVFDVAMAPILSLNCGYRSDICRHQSVSRFVPVSTAGVNVLPAPNASALGNSTSSTTRKTIEGDMPLSMCSAIFCDLIDCLQKQSVVEAKVFSFVYFVGVAPPPRSIRTAQPRAVSVCDCLSEDAHLWDVFKGTGEEGVTRERRRRKRKKTRSAVHKQPTRAEKNTNQDYAVYSLGRSGQSEADKQTTVLWIIMTATIAAE